MSFVQMATDNPLGKRPINYMSLHQGAPPALAGLRGLGWFGDTPTPGDYDNNQAVLGELVAMGAISQDDATNIWNGTASLDDMAVNMTMINQALQLSGQTGTATVLPLPSPSSVGPSLVSLPSPVTTPTAAPAAAAANQIPAGSTITYNVTWSTSILNPTLGASQVASALQAALPAHQMSLISSTTNSLPVIGAVTGISQTFQIQAQVAFATIAAVQSVLDGLMNSITGNNLSGSSIGGVYAPSGSTTTGAILTTAPTAAATLTSAAPYLALGAVAFLGLLVLMRR